MRMRISPTPFEALSLAVRIAGTQFELAEIVKKTQPTVSRWVDSSKRLPAEHCIAVERATGIDRHYLRPDIYPLEGRDPMPLPDHPAVRHFLSQFGGNGSCETVPILHRNRPSENRRAAA